MNKLISTLMSTNAGYGITLLRIVTGLTFAAHGAQKLFGWFGGYGLEGVAQWMESIGITPGYLMAALAGSAEFFGGLALVVGLLVRPAAVSLLVSMVVAAVTLQHPAQTLAASPRLPSRRARASRSYATAPASARRATTAKPAARNT